MSQTSALDLLRGIETATFRHAAPLPLKEDAHPQWQGMGFQVGGLRLVSAMGEIDEILKPPKVAALPGVKSWVLGVANVRGRLIPVVDLHEFSAWRRPCRRHSGGCWWWRTTSSWPVCWWSSPWASSIFWRTVSRRLPPTRSARWRLTCVARSGTEAESFTMRS